MRPYLPEEPELLLLSEEPELLLPGDSDPPVADEPLESPKCDRMLWRQPGCVRSVFASKLGACCNLVVSPVNTKLSCCPLVALPTELLLVPEVAELLLKLEEAGRRSIHGTATCLPLADEYFVPELLDSPEELGLPEAEPLGAVPPELLE